MIQQIFNDIVEDLKLLQRDLPGFTVVLALALAASIGIQINILHTATSKEIHLRTHYLGEAGSQVLSASNQNICDPEFVPGVTVVIDLSRNSFELSIPASNVAAILRTARSNATTAFQRVTG